METIQVQKSVKKQ